MIYDVIILGNNLEAHRAALALQRAGRSVAVVADEIDGWHPLASDLNRWLDYAEIDDDWMPALRLFRQEAEQIRHANMHWFSSFGIDLHKGTARFVDANSILVSGLDGDTFLQADHFVIASDEFNRPMQNGDIDSRLILTPDQLTNGDEIPKNIAIVYDDHSQHGRWGELSRFTNVVSQLAGWKQVVSITESSSGRLIVQTRQQGVFIVDAILVDQPVAQTGDLELGSIGVETTPTGHIKTDDFLRSTLDHVFAIGSVARFANREPIGDRVSILVDQILNPTIPVDQTETEVFTQDDFQGLRLVLG